jgi:hypothetical protein
VPTDTRTLKNPPPLAPLFFLQGSRVVMSGSSGLSPLDVVELLGGVHATITKPPEEVWVMMRESGKSVKITVKITA